MSPTQIKSKRPTCPTCSRPTRVCLCTRIQNAGHENKVHITILQHSLEKKHPLNSSRIVKSGLRNVTLEIVFDVNFRAQFIIRLIESGKFRPECEGSGLSEDLQRIGTQKRKFDDDVRFSIDRESEINCVLTGFESVKCIKEGSSELGDGFLKGSNSLVSNGFLKGSNSLVSNGSDLEIHDELITNGLIGANEQESVITATISKYGLIMDLQCVWMDGNERKNKLSFDQIIGSKEAVGALGEGFVVKKLREETLNGGLLVESVEFELEVPHGSVLLFPSEKALSVKEAKEMGLEVKNLIVLDGTWVKARRMYEENPWLRLLPHLKLDSVEGSLYSEVRRQPKSGYLSTIESIVHAMKAVGDNTEVLDNLLDVFESMVVDQRRCKDERLSKASMLIMDAQNDWPIRACSDHSVDSQYALDLLVKGSIVKKDLLHELQCYDSMDSYSDMNR